MQSGRLRKRSGGGWEFVSVVEHVLNLCKALSSILSMAKESKRAREKKREKKKEELKKIKEPFLKEKK